VIDIVVANEYLQNVSNLTAGAGRAVAVNALSDSPPTVSRVRREHILRLAAFIGHRRT
jgi:hypothetical protein